MTNTENRELKFRVWDSNNNRWLENSKYCIYHGHPQQLEHGSTEYLENESSYNPLRFVEDTTGLPYYDRSLKISQYTGVTDQNGKEIYEGDIIRDVVGEFNTVVFWDNKFACWVAGLGFLDKHQFVASVISDSPSCGRRKIVIGNIFENPEFLTTL
jgi:uncharacterized phage protein (TIGR01671 family)